MEIWRKIDEHPNYEVSNQNGFRNTTRNKQPNGRINHWGYRMVRFGRNTKEIAFHILVAKSFPEICGEWFDGCAVHHKDGNKLNNTPENLIVLSKEEHHKLHYKEAPDSFKTCTEKRAVSISKALKGKKCTNGLERAVKQYTKDMKFVAHYDTITQAAETNGYDISNISKGLRGKLKAPYGFIWQYGD